jgi:prolyl oligopeptidase
VTGFDVEGDNLYLLTHKNASRFKVVSLALARPDLATAQVVVPQSEAVVTGIAAAKDALYVRRMNGGVSDLLRAPYSAGARPAPVKLPFAGDVDGLTADPRRPGAVFNLGGWTRFGGYFATNPRSTRSSTRSCSRRASMTIRRTSFRPKSRSRRKTARSCRCRSCIKGLKLDGSNPTILYGYGACGISERRSTGRRFCRGSIAAACSRSRTCARRGIRRGLAQGRLQAKPSTWNDAIACAEWLVAHKYTSPAKLAIMGSSAAASSSDARSRSAPIFSARQSTRSPCRT